MSVKIKNLSKKLLTIALMMSLILTGTMMLRSENCIAATKETSPYTVVPRQVKNADGTITVIIKGYGQITSFDIGVVYDNTKVKVVDLDFKPGFKRDFTADGKEGVTACGIVDNSYVVFGGARLDDNAYFLLEDMVTVTFKVIGNDPGSVMVVLDSASYNKDFTGAENVSTTRTLKLTK